MTTPLLKSYAELELTPNTLGDTSIWPDLNTHLESGTTRVNPRNQGKQYESPRMAYPLRVSKGGLLSRLARRVPQVCSLTWIFLGRLSAVIDHNRG